MSSIKEVAMKFFDACESGKGWEGCMEFCHDSATFSAQADALQGIETLKDYTNWLQAIYTPAPDANYEILGFAADEDRNLVLGFGIFRATHTADGGPVPPTNKSVNAEYVYVMKFEGDKISHVTKVWNDGFSLRQIGWM